MLLITVLYTQGFRTDRIVVALTDGHQTYRAHGFTAPKRALKYIYELEGEGNDFAENSLGEVKKLELVANGYTY